MSLIETLTEYCDQVYRHMRPCVRCTHPSGRCSGGCKQCSEEVNYHHNRPGCRSEYNCQKFLYYYVCRYSWKYCSEIIHALDVINLDDYPEFRVLSLGCGGAPDLMAFEEVCPPWKNIFYKGYDYNELWQPIYNAIDNYADARPNIQTYFSTADIFEILENNLLPPLYYNVVVLEYILSHFPPADRAQQIERLLDDIITLVLPKRLPEFPFLIIINDIDHYCIRNHFDPLLQKLDDSGYKFKCWKLHFHRKDEYNDGSMQHVRYGNYFQIPENIKELYSCAITCSSAQLIIEVLP